MTTARDAVLVRPRRAVSVPRAAAFAAAMLIVIAPGCYRHVVRAEGVGTSGVDVYEPNHKPGPIEKLLEPKRDTKYRSPYGGR